MKVTVDKETLEDLLYYASLCDTYLTEDYAEEMEENFPLRVKQGNAAIDKVREELDKLK